MESNLDYLDMTEQEQDDFAAQVEAQKEEEKWLRRASETYSSSTEYLDSSIRSQWEDNLYNFRLQNRDVTQKNKKMFRPKIRSAHASHSAALAAALFTNNDLTTISSLDKNNELQEVSAKLNQELMQHRLSATIPWFSTVIGAQQDTHIYGICISKTYWAYESQDEVEVVPVTNELGEFVYNEDGDLLGEEVAVEGSLLRDEPVINLIAPENFRFDPNADWRDPISDSPYLIEQIPMHAADIIERMGKVDDKTGQPVWSEFTVEQLSSASTYDRGSNSTRNARQGNDRGDAIDTSPHKELDIIWVHFNIYRDNGIDMAYYTVGTSLLLSEPVPLTDYYAHGREVYTMGTSSVETHRTYPAGLFELGKDLQREANVLADQRNDNVRLMLNKRYHIKRDGNVDMAALMKNVAGGGVLMNDVNDVHVVPTPDVTSSSYAEQDRINMDLDEMLGTFSAGSVQGNRALNETVGGMNLMSSGANNVQELAMRMFIESWVEPVLRTLVKLIQRYETDDTIIAIAAGKAGVRDEVRALYEDPEHFDSMIQQELTVKVNVGMGNTNPAQKLDRLMMAINTTANMPEVAAGTDWAQVTKEVYSFAGYGDGDRFLLGEQPPQEPPQDPAIALETMRLQARQEEVKFKADHESNQLQMKLESDQATRVHIEQIQAEADVIKINSDREMRLMQMAKDEGIKLEELRTRLDIASSADTRARDIAAIRESNISRELNIKVETGSGI